MKLLEVIKEIENCGCGVYTNRLGDTIQVGCGGHIIYKDIDQKFVSITPNGWTKEIPAVDWERALAHMRNGGTATWCGFAYRIKNSTLERQNFLTQDWQDAEFYTDMVDSIAWELN